MRHSLTISPLERTDKKDWLRLWNAYGAFYQSIVTPEVTEGTWQRFLDPAFPMGCLVAHDEDGHVIGFVTYVLHLNTFSPKHVCYLEDLFVDEAARGMGAGRALIDAVIQLGRDHDWRRIYWHTRPDNHSARKLYDTYSPVGDWVRYDVNLEG